MSALRPAAVLAQVEADLRALWTTAPAAGQAPKTRACTMNLVVIVTGAALERWGPIVDEVLQEVPARAVVVGLDPDGKDSLEASVSAVCTPGSGTIVCSERVTLQIGGALCARVASCVDAVCASDVPTTLVWPGRVRVDDPAFAPLARSSYRLVLEASNGPFATLGKVLRWAQARPAGERPGVAELAWTRLAPWQEFCARIFDDGRTRPLANAVTRVRLVQALAAGTTLGTEGALMLGWLGSRLGWKASSMAGKLQLLRSDGVPIQAELQAASAAAVPRGALLAVEIEARREAVFVRGEVTRDADSAGTWRLEVTTAGETQRVKQHVGTFGDGHARTLERTLRRPVHDEALAESVAWAAELGDDLACA